MRIRWEADAWTEYVGWQSDKAVLRRINQLIRDIQRSPFEGIGKPKATLRAARPSERPKARFLTTWAGVTIHRKVKNGSKGDPRIGP